jgi:hypothetical protein
VGLQEADAGPVRRSSLAGIVCHVCRAPFVGATATSSVRSACTEACRKRRSYEASRRAGSVRGGIMGYRAMRVAPGLSGPD